MLFWNFAFAAVIAWLLYAALKSRIDLAMGQLKHDITLEMGNLKQRPEEAPKNETLKNDLDVGIRKQVFQDCPRYGIHDAYTISELSRFYEREDGRGRSRLCSTAHMGVVCIGTIGSGNRV
jgi:hypothetical protein